MADADFQADLEAYGVSPWMRNPGVYAIAVYRWGRRLELSASRGFRWKASDRLYWVTYRVVDLLTGITLPRTAVFGPGLLIHHHGAIVIHPDVVAGARCGIRQGVTLGTRSFANSGGVPVLGDDVELGAHCQVLGPVSIGSGARIGALALVTQDVPAGGVAYGPRAEVRAG